MKSLSLNVTGKAPIEDSPSTTQKIVLVLAGPIGLGEPIVTHVEDRVILLTKQKWEK